MGERFIKKKEKMSKYLFCIMFNLRIVHFALNESTKIEFINSNILVFEQAIQRENIVQ